MKYLILLTIAIPFYVFAQDPAPADVIAALPENPPIHSSVTDAPEWLESAMLAVSSIPVVGPVVVEIAKWLGVISSILTILVSAILALIKVLGLVLPAARLASIALWVAKLEGSAVMYWLKFFSMYNAKKDEQKKS